MDIPHEALSMRRGIYAAIVVIGETRYHAALYFGPPITFGITTDQLEAYLLDTEAVVLNEHTDLSVEFVAHIRDVEVFPDSDALIRQMHLDVQDVRRALHC
jgi:FAD synthase